MVYLENNLDFSLKKVLQVMQDRIMNQTSYFGVKALKCPVDFWIYQEIIFETKPDVLIEIGNHSGGSTLALAHIFDNMGKGRVIGVDINHSRVPEVVRNHPRITFLQGDAVKSYEQVRDMIGVDESVMIIEDSSHTYENTLNVLETYESLVKPSHYFIVEDGICYHGLEVGPKPGPYEAIEAFIERNRNFEIDRGRESFLITWNPKGYLKRVAN